MVALASVFLGAVYTATSILTFLESWQGLGWGSLRAVLSSGLMKTDMFLVDSQEKSGNMEPGDLSRPAWNMK